MRSQDSDENDSDSESESTAEDEGKLQQIQDQKTPSDIEFESIIVDIDFHPFKDFIASGSIDGDVSLHSYCIEGKNHQVMSFHHHKRACRAVKFSPDGNILFTASKDKSIAGIDVNEGKVLSRVQKAHSSAIYSLLVVDNFLMATGDDNGCVKLWDYRRQQSVMEMKDCEEFISDMATDNRKKIVLAASGEGTLTAYNIRAKRMELQSELFDSELLSVCVIKNGKKVVTGSGDGVLNIFNWDEWGNFSDRFPGHSLSVDCIVPISETVICTGSLDGKVRAVSIHPNAKLGVIGNHDGFPVENLSKSHDNSLIASCSHDQKLKFWDVSHIEDPAEGMGRKERKQLIKERNAASSSSHQNFFADL